MYHPSKLKSQAQREMLEDIAIGITEFAKNRDDQCVELLLCEIDMLFNNLDQDDFFGTEGWKHNFGIE